MGWIKKEKDEEFSAVEFKRLNKVLKSAPQVGKSNKLIDSKRKALSPGKRISKSGKIYWETRKNRSDMLGKKI